MSICSATKSLAEDIAVSHEARIAGVSDIVKETHQTLENFEREREERTTALRSELSSLEQDRKQEFATFIGSIRGEVATLEKDTTQMLTDFRRDHRGMTDALRSKLSSSERDRRQEFATFQRNLRENVARTRTKIAADHRQARTHWERSSKTMAARRASF